MSTKRARESTPSDPFGTEELRRRVLEAWRASPARFRADANVEDDLALVGYRDRLVVELAQNASDAAARAGHAGGLRLTLDGPRLLAANTGAALDAAGLESIAVARASAKRGDVALVGRFGVGFAAVLSVSDEPAIRSTSGAVRWSRAESLATVSGLPELAEELAASGGHTAVLRLPMPASGEPPAGYDTEIELPLRDDTAVDAVRAQLADLDPTLLLSLTGLSEIVVSTGDFERRLRREDGEGDSVMLYDDDRLSRWVVVEASGALDPALLVGQPAEARDRDRWSVRCALPVDSAGTLAPLPDDVARVVRAPTATDDACSLPLVVIGSYPLDAIRRRITPGPLTDAVSHELARLLVDRIASMPATTSLITLVPRGLPSGEVDAVLQEAVRVELQETAWLPAASDTTARLRPS
ncbi:MAG TPA: ATP-binding protein, partial [Mycobacteriales bacterium]|nr:ATP-binding protein [Mycobacteriales bacterium]